MPLEDDVRKQGESINQLTVGLTRLGGMVENTMEKLDRVATTMDRHNDNMSGMVSMQKDIASINEKIADQYADIAANRHDFKNVQNALQGMPLMADKITNNSKDIVKHDTRLDAQQGQINDIKSWRDKCDGAGITKYKDDIESIRSDISTIRNIAKTGWKALAVFGSVVVVACGGLSWVVAHVFR